MSEKKFAKILKNPVSTLFWGGFFGAIASELYRFIIYTVFAQPTSISVDMIGKVVGATFVFFVILAMVTAMIVHIFGRS